MLGLRRERGAVVSAQTDLFGGGTRAPSAVVAWAEVPATALVTGARVLTNAAGGGMPLIRVVASTSPDADGWVSVHLRGGGTLDAPPGSEVWARLPAAGETL